MPVAAPNRMGMSPDPSVCRHSLANAAYLVISSCVALSLAQDEAVRVGGAAYWILFIGAAIPLLVSVPSLIVGSLSRSSWAGMFVAVTVFWSVIRGDTDDLLLIVLMGASWIYAQTSESRLSARWIARCYLFVVILGILYWAFDSSNYYELLPGVINDERSKGRVSFAGNVGFAGMLSLLVCLVLLSQKHRTRSMLIALAVSIYFIIFSQVRTAIIGIGIYLGVRFVLARWRALGPIGIFLVAFTAIAAALLVVAISPLVLSGLRPIPIVSDVFLQGGQDLDADAIQEQVYRSLLWATQIELFLSSPYLMGWGAAASTMTIPGGADVSIGGDTVAFPTRLLSHYGLPGLLFFLAAFSALWAHARRKDIESVSAWPVCVLVLFSWGSIFHPTDATGFFFLCLMFKGISGFR